MRSLAIVLLFLAVAAGAAAATPTGAHTLPVGNTTLSFWFGEDNAVIENANGTAAVSLWFALPTNDTHLVAYVNVTTANASFSPAAIVVDAHANSTALANATYVPDANASGVQTVAYAFEGRLYNETNGTLSFLAPISGSGSFTIDLGAKVAAPPTGIPTLWLIVGAAVVVVGGGAIAITARQRAIKRRMNEAPRRSQVMREMELEEKLEKARDPEQVQEIKQEIRAQEVVREKRRELQILEAKRADALKTMDLLKKRHEAGGLTKLQYDNMVAKKQADLAKIDAEIAQMEREDQGAGAAA